MMSIKVSQTLVTWVLLILLLIYADIGPLAVTPPNKVPPKQRKAYNQKCSQLSLGTLDVSFGPTLMALSHFYPKNYDFSAIFRVLGG